MLFCNIFIFSMTLGMAYSATVIDSLVNDTLTEWQGIGLTAWSVDSDANVCTLGVSGERIRGSGQLLQTTGDSRHHVGSVTKSITASLLAILMQQGRIPDGWNTTMVQVIPEANGGPYENVTLRELTGSISGMANFPPEDTEFPPFDPNDLHSYRRAVALAAVNYPPVHPPGTTYLYSNWAWVTAGYVIESITNMLWEEALTMYLFEPLGIDLGNDMTQYVGPPNNDHDPWGHEGFIPCDPSQDDCDNPAVLGPAGTFSGPVAAMATYFAWHLACHNGQHTTLLSQEACQEIHQPADSSVSNYGYGWVCYNHPDVDQGHVCTHNGSNTLNYYNVTLVFGRDKAYSGYTNAASRPELQNVFMVNQVVGSLFQQDEKEECMAPFSSSVYVNVNQPTGQPSTLSSSTQAPTSGPIQDTSSASSLLWQCFSLVTMMLSFILL